MSNDEKRSVTVDHFLREGWQAVGGDTSFLTQCRVTGEGALPSRFAVSDLAAATMGVAHLAVGELLHATLDVTPQVVVDRRLASLWFSTSLRPQGWSLPGLWDVVAGDYPTADGWIRLHTNAPHHREAALSVLGTAADREAVAKAVSAWQGSALESAIVERQGCAAAMRTTQAWAQHPQGLSVAREPLLHWATSGSANTAEWTVLRERPLQGVRVLDLTRILAGPVATRVLASFGAQVLRIDPYGWEEPGSVPEVVLGKRCARLNLREATDRAVLEQLLREADVLVHGYRADALARLGLDAERRRALNPGLVDISLNAYGWTGPWRERRGFDSLVQMSTGIADAGMQAAGADKPVPLPVQALDHATGYLLAAAAVRGLTRRRLTGEGCEARASLARTAKLLVDAAVEPQPPVAAANERDFAPDVEHTSWGPALRLKPAAQVEGAPARWSLAARALGSDQPVWQ